MNKKTYITPELEVMNIETVEMMATSGSDNTIDLYGTATTDDAKMSTGRRGAWGNLWNE